MKHFIGFVLPNTADPPETVQSSNSQVKLTVPQEDRFVSDLFPGQAHNLFIMTTTPLICIAVISYMWMESWKGYAAGLWKSIIISKSNSLITSA